MRPGAHLVEELFGLVGGGRPLPGTDRRAVQVKGVFRDGAQLRSGGEILADMLPSGSVGGPVVEVSFEPVRRVAPHGSTRPAGRDGPEQFDVPRRGSLGEIDDAGGTGAVEGVVDHFEAGGE